MFAPDVKTMMLVDKVRFTGDGVYRKGSEFFEKAVKKCGSSACGLACIVVADTDLLQGKSDIKAECANCERDCPLSNQFLRDVAVELRFSSPDELEAGPNFSDGANLGVDNS